MKTISIVTHAYNEEGNIEAMYLRVREIMNGFRQYRYEHVVIADRRSNKINDMRLDVPLRNALFLIELLADKSIGAEVPTSAP